MTEVKVYLVRPRCEATLAFDSGFCAETEDLPVESGNRFGTRKSLEKRGYFPVIAVSDIEKLNRKELDQLISKIKAGER